VRERRRTTANLGIVLLVDVLPSLRRNAQLLPRLDGTRNVAIDRDAFGLAESLDISIGAFRNSLVLHVEVLLDVRRSE
jgi:hypothetical protein